MAAQVVTKETLKRIISDITDLVKNPLHDNGIYYEHDEANMLKGYILIIPTNKSPYQFGNYFFSVEFPVNYPYSPPKMTYMTNNGHTRFHPNLYRNGRVCLSILNTWKGDKWTSCNTLSSVLLHVATLFTEKPFLHEPGITENHADFRSYTKVIEYQNYQTAIYDILGNNVNLPDVFYEKFSVIVNENYEKNKNDIMDVLKSRKNREEREFDITFYKMKEIVNYNEMYLKLKRYNASL
jgi:ubiquitin-protein ligase